MCLFCLLVKKLSPSFFLLRGFLYCHFKNIIFRVVIVLKRFISHSYHFYHLANKVFFLIPPLRVVEWIWCVGEYGPINRNHQITPVLTIYHVKLLQSTALERDLPSLLCLVIMIMIIIMIIIKLIIAKITVMILTTNLNTILL